MVATFVQYLHLRFHTVFINVRCNCPQSLIWCITYTFGTCDFAKPIKNGL